MNIGRSFCKRLNQHTTFSAYAPRSASAADDQISTGWVGFRRPDFGCYWGVSEGHQAGLDPRLSGLGNLSAESLYARPRCVFESCRRTKDCGRQDLLTCARHAQSVMKNLGRFGDESVTMEIATHRKPFPITCFDLAFSSQAL